MKNSKWLIVTTVSIILVLCLLIILTVVYTSKQYTTGTESFTKNTSLLEQLIKALELLPAYVHAVKCSPTCTDKIQDESHSFPDDWCVAKSCFLGFLVQMNRDALISPAIDYSSNYWGSAFNFTSKSQKFFNLIPFPPAKGGFDSIVIIGQYPSVMVLNISFYDFAGAVVTSVFVDVDLKPYDTNPFRTGNFGTQQYYCVCATTLSENDASAYELKKITDNIAWKGLALDTDERKGLGSYIVRYYGVYDSLTGGVDVPKVYYVDSKKKQAFLTNDVALPHNHFEKILFEYWESGKEKIPTSISNQNCYQFLPQGPFAGKANIPCIDPQCATDPQYFRMSLSGAGALWSNPSAAYMATCLVRQPGKAYILYGQRPTAPSYPTDVHTMKDTVDMRYWSFNLCEYSKLVNVLTGLGNRQIPVIQKGGRQYFGIVLSEKLVRQSFTMGNIAYLRWPQQRQALQVFYRNTLTNSSFQYSVDRSIEKAQKCFHGCQTCCCTEKKDSVYRQCCHDEKDHACFPYDGQPCPATTPCPQTCPDISVPKQVNVCNANTLTPQLVMKNYYPRIGIVDESMICFPNKIVDYILKQMSLPTCANDFHWPSTCL
jgi:hypothetical protein